MHRDESPMSRSTGERSTIAQDRLYAEKMAAILGGDFGSHWGDKCHENGGFADVKDQTNDSADPPTGSPELIFKLRDGIELLDRCIGMHHIVVLNDKRVGKFYHLGGHEADVLSLMNGKLSVTEIADSLQRDGIQWGAEEVQGWALMLVKSGLAVSLDRDGNPVAVGNPPPTVARDDANHQEPPKPMSNVAIQKAIGPLGYVISQRFPIASADAIAGWMLPVIGRLFTYSGGAIWLVAVAFSLGLAWSHSHSLGIELRMMFSPAALPLLAVIWVIQKAVHEIGHAVAAKRAGVRVGKFGITFFLFAPIPYVDVTDAWRLSRVWSRV
ncbi:MAG TPA: hypothetical protein DDZ51_08880, partial [Planctomycetaceae bacterium]|nr:hypothetical protein [Planctomycetaceae bacterium]